MRMSAEISLAGDEIRVIRCKSLSWLLGGGLWHYVYVLRNDRGQLYVGYTSNLVKRVHDDQDDKGGWTRGRGEWELVHFEGFLDRDQALRRERSLKNGQGNLWIRRWLNELKASCDGVAGGGGTPASSLIEGEG